MVFLLLPILIGANSHASTGGNWFFTIINNLLYMVIWPVFVAISIAMFMWAGFLYLTAQDDSTKVATANKAVIFAIIGIIIILLSYGYMNYLRSNLNNGGGAGGGAGANGQRVCCTFGEDANSRNVCGLSTQNACAGAFGIYRADLTSCTPNPCQGGGGDVGGNGDVGGGGDWGGGGQLPACDNLLVPQCNGSCAQGTCRFIAEGCKCV